MRKISFLFLFLITWSSRFYAQTTTISCAPDTTISSTPLLCTGTASLRVPIINNAGSQVNLGNALAFDGVDDYVRINNNTSANFTLEANIKTTATSLTGTLAYQGNSIIWSDVAGGANDFTLAILNNKVSFFDGNKGSGITGNTTITDGLWHHIAITRQSGGLMTIYVDGLLDASASAGTGGLIANPNIMLGGNTLDNKYFNGSLDEVRIWNTARSQAEILATIGTELAGNESGLVAYYNFNQGIAGGTNTSTTTLLDKTSNSNNGILNNFSLTTALSNWVAGATTIKKIYGNALNFEGATDFVSINTGSKSVSGSFTVEAYVKPSSVNPYYTIFSTRTQGNTFDLKLMNGNQIACDFGNTSNSWILTNAVATFNYSANTWYHIAVVVTPANYTIYVNGQQVGSGVLADGTPLLYNSNGIITIGAAYNNATENFQGTIDEVRVWNTARTPSQILSTMQLELNAQAGLVAAYHFSEGVAAGGNTGISTTADASGNNLNGTLTNFARTGTVSNWVTGQSFDAKLSNNAPATYPIGNTTVTWTATDAAGNTATCNQTVTVVSPTGTQVLAPNNLVIADGDVTPTVNKLTDFGSTGSYRTFTISNPSSAPLIIDNITITGTNVNEFGISNILLPAIIAANGQITFSLFFAPTGAGIKNATVNIATNNCSIGNYDFAVRGTGATVQSVVFNATGTYTPLPGVTSVVVQAWGSGANGGNFTNAYQGGGGGAFLQSKPLTVSAPVSIGIASRQLGQNGITSFFGGFGSAISANGTLTSAGGAATTGPDIAFSYKGGDGGAEKISGGFGTGGCGNAGGGGGAAGTSGAGGNGQQSSGLTNAAGGVAGNGGGNGGTGGYFNGSNCSIIGGTNPTQGAAPGGGGGAGTNSALGGNGRIIVFYTCDPSPGVIGNAHSVPYPPQLIFDSILNISGTAPTAENRLVYTWETKTDFSNWGPAKNSYNALSYRFDRDSITVPTYFRRVTNACGTVGYSDTVKINVINPVNGIIEGKVVSKNGSPVKGIIIYAQKAASLPGSPISWKDSAVTGIDGKYKIQRGYYGDPSEGANNGSVETNFVITPVLPNHSFNPASLSKSLSNISPQIIGVDFTDTTALSISGKTYQKCIGCLNAANIPDTVIAALDSVEMYRDNIFATKSGLIDSSGEYGKYAVIVTDPGRYKIEPRFKSHKFTPVSVDTTIQVSVGNIDFNDTTTATISGNFTAGCGDYIGTVTLEFQDVLPNGLNNLPRTGTLRKRVTTQVGTGFYSIRLPARKYAVKLVEGSFTAASGGDINAPDLFDFFDTQIPKDSLVKDISTANATFNVVYNRAPTMQVLGLDPVCTGLAYALFPQNIEKTFLVKVFQGAAAKNCPVTDTTLKIITNIQKDDASETLIISLKQAGVFEVKLTGGTPNIIEPFNKVLDIQFLDTYGRTVDTNQPVVVTGVKTNVGSFTTVSPQIPLMVLHDPPGDNSYSSWKKDVTNQTATRFYTSKSKTAGSWADIKLGIAYQVGVGEFVTIGTNVATWGTIGNSINVSSTQNNAAEAIVTTTTSQTFSTSNNASVIGSKGDVFIGAAVNLLYTGGTEVRFDVDSCKITSEKKLVIANNGFNTEFIYSEDHIRNRIIPDLTEFKDLSTDSIKKAEYANQISVWEQTLKNNTDNKAHASFEKNWSFDGAAGPYTNTTTSASSKSNTIEFATTIDRSVALELGYEIAGSGVSAGVTTNWKMETGSSTTNTTLATSTFEYVLDDGDNGDFYSVDVKKDPVYNSPVFELVSGNSSCPFEPGTQPRDGIQLIAQNPSVTGVAPDGEAEFILKLGNTSQSHETRTYNFSFVQGSNPGGAVVTIGGSPAVAAPIPYRIGYLSEIPIVVKVKRGLSSTFSYEGLQFLATDSCDGSVSKTASIAAFFEGTCGDITLSAPANNWVMNNAANNILPITFTKYNLANITNVELQYTKTGTDSWSSGFIKYTAELSSSINGTTVNWNISSVADGSYYLRLKMICPSGIVYSERMEGIIDRTAPLVFGNPEPTDDNLVAGDQISISYNEALDVSRIDSSNVKLYRLSDKQQLPASIVGYANQLIVMPGSSLLNNLNDSFRVVIQHIPDIYGNIKATADSFRFTVGKSIADTSGKAINLSVSKNSIVNTTGARAATTPAQRNLFTSNTLAAGDSTIAVYFDLKNNAVNDTRINFNIGGTAVYGKDYDIRFDSVATSFVNRFDGITGSLVIAKNTRRGIVRIDPIYGANQNNSKTISISALEGGDYELGNSTTATVYILNVLASGIFEFTGTGNFSASGNWLNNIKPGTSLPAGSEILINPIIGGECILDVPLTIMPGGKLTIAAGKKFWITGSLQIK